MISNTSNVEWYVKILAILKNLFFIFLFFLNIQDMLPPPSLGFAPVSSDI